MRGSNRDESEGNQTNTDLGRRRSILTAGASLTIFASVYTRRSRRCLSANVGDFAFGTFLKNVTGHWSSS